MTSLSQATHSKAELGFVQEQQSGSEELRVRGAQEQELLVL